MKNYAFILASIVAGTFLGVLLAVALIKDNPEVYHHSSGIVTVYPKKPDDDKIFYTVGDDLFCDDIILENGEVSIHDHPYSATFTNFSWLGGKKFADVCYLNDLHFSIGDKEHEGQGE